MTIYGTIKAAISVKQAAEHYGLKVNRNGMACCPFHNDRHPSLKLNEDYFFCFGCGAKGDVIDLVARLFNLSSYEAAQKLASDFGLDPKPPTAAAMAKPKRPYIRQFREDEMLCFRVLTDYLHLLEDWKVRYAPKTPEEALDDRFVEACQMHCPIEYMADVLTVGDLEERVALVDELMKEGKITFLQEYIKKIQEVTLPNLRQQLAETTGIFKGKDRKALEKQIQQTETELAEKLDKIPDILKDDGYPDVQAFMKTYRKAEAIVTQYNQDLAEWEQAVKNGRKPAEKQHRPPERQSVRNRLRQLQEEGKQNAQPKQRKKSQDRDR